MTQLIIQVSKDVAYGLHHKGADTDGSKVLLTETNRLGLDLHAMHPDVDDAELQSYFVAELSDASIANNIIEDLMKVPNIEAAYIKPADELP